MSYKSRKTILALALCGAILATSCHLTYSAAAGRDVDAVIDVHGNTALIQAIRDGRTNEARVLLGANASVNKTNKHGATALMYAKNVEVVLALLEAKANVNKSSDDGTTALMSAALRGNIGAVQALLDVKARVSVSGRSDKTVLMYAIEGKNIEIVQALLDAKADTNKIDQLHNTALGYAAQGKNVEIVQVLLKAKADVNKNADGYVTVLYGAVREDNLEIVQALLDAGADVDKGSGYNGITALISAAQLGSLDSVKALLAIKADVDKTCTDGETALIVAGRNWGANGIFRPCSDHCHHAEVIQVLLAHGSSYAGLKISRYPLMPAILIEHKSFLEKQFKSRVMSELDGRLFNEKWLEGILADFIVDEDRLAEEQKYLKKIKNVCTVELDDVPSKCKLL